MTAKEKAAADKLATEQLATAKAIELRRAALIAACATTARELSAKVHTSIHKDDDGNEYKVYTRRAHKPQEQADGTFAPVETGRVTLVPVSALPDTVTPEEKLAWNRVKRDMAHRMVLHPGMTVDAIGLGKDSSGRNRGIIRVVQSSIPVQAESGEKLLASVAEQLASVKL